MKGKKQIIDDNDGYGLSVLPTEQGDFNCQRPDELKFGKWLDDLNKIITFAPDPTGIPSDRKGMPTP